MSRRLPISLAALAAFVAVLNTGPAPAQTWSEGSPGDFAKIPREHIVRFDGLLKGAQEFEAGDEAIAKVMAQLYVYRITWTKTREAKVGGLVDCVKEFDRQITGLAVPNLDKNEKFLTAFNNALIASFKQVFSKTKPDGDHITITNLALMLPSLAKTKQQAVADYLVELVQGKESHDVIRFGAVKGLREFFPLPRRMQEQMKARDARLVNAVLEYVTRTWAADADVKEELDAARFMRREGIRTLAAIGLPAVDVTKEGKVAAPVAYGLARVLAGGKSALSPPPSLSEKLEAALGICQLRSDIVPEYQPEAALRLVGEFLVELSTEYIKDYPHFSTKDKDLRKIPLLPWKSAAVRLEQGLQTLTSTLPAKALAQGNAKNVQDAAGSVLRNIKAHALQDQPTNLRRAVASMKVPEPSLYKNAKGYEVELPGIGE